MTAGRKLAIGQEEIERKRERGREREGSKDDPFNYLCMWQDTVAATDAPATAAS